jgi:hypothetical protein
MTWCTTEHIHVLPSHSVSKPHVQHVVQGSIVRLTSQDVEHVLQDVQHALEVGLPSALLA